MKNRNVFKNVIIAGVVACGMLIALAGCSSAPKRQMLYTDIANRAYDYYEKANGAIVRGEFEKAGKYLEDSYALAVSIDKNDLICRILLSAVSFRIENPAVDLVETDFRLPLYIDVLLEEAKVAASLSDVKQRSLLESIIRVYECRARLVKAQNGLDGVTNSEIQKVLDAEIKNLAKEPYYLAFLYRTKGEWSSFLMNYKAAADYFESAADVHTKNRYLYEIAYDWYLCAKSLSRDGKKAEALEAVQKALKYDRDAENTPAIAQDYMAAAYILCKKSPSDTERKQAVFYAERAEKIYRSIGYTEQAENCCQWILDNK